MATLLLAWALLAVVAAHGLRLVAFVVSRLPGPKPATPSRGERVALVRPFRGLEPDALEKNRSLVHQRYAPLEVWFVAGSRDDAGAGAARAACREAPGRARFLAAGAGGPIVSGKARNMIAGWHASDAPFVAFCDSDLELAPDDVARCMALFDAPDVGAVFTPCFFDTDDFAGRLASLVATADASVLVAAGARTGKLNVLQGGLMVLRRSTVERCGGIELVADALADDLRLGRVLRRAGHRLRATSRPLVHRTSAEGTRAWISRYHRWMLCQKTEAPLAFWAMLLLNPTVVPLAAVLVPGAGLAARTVLAAGLGGGIALTALVDRLVLRPAGIRLGRMVLLRPAADALHALACLGALVWPRFAWRGTTYRIARGGRLLAATAMPRRTDATAEEERAMRESNAA